MVKLIKKLSIIGGIGTAVAAPLGAYYSTINEIRAEYVRKSEIEKMRDKVDKIAEDVAEIKGFLKPRR